MNDRGTLATPATGRLLLDLARAAMEAAVRGRHAPAVPPGIAVDAFGVFVTIHHRSDLRGCLGALDCRGRIAAEVARLAAAVTRDDFRFAPLSVSELAQTTIDLSLLTIPQPVVSIEAIEVGRHGLIVEKGRRRGLLLPQVAPAHGWDRDTFLRHTCLKAGLPADAWQHGAEILCFEADLVREEDAAY